MASLLARVIQHSEAWIGVDLTISDADFPAMLLKDVTDKALVSFWEVDRASDADVGHLIAAIFSQNAVNRQKFESLELRFVQPAALSRVGIRVSVTAGKCEDPTFVSRHRDLHVDTCAKAIALARKMLEIEAMSVPAAIVRKHFVNSVVEKRIDLSKFHKQLFKELYENRNLAISLGPNDLAVG